MKKNRRGLGRGLEALIQSTAPMEESDSAAWGEAADESNPMGAESPSTPEETTDIAPVVEEQGSRSDAETGSEPREGTAGSSSEAGAPADSVDLEASTAAPSTPRPERSRQSRPDLTSRYLSGRSNAGAGDSVPRETRRPVDVFFPDRRSDEEVDLVGTGGSTRKTRQRATMPPLQPRGKSGPKPETETDSANEGEKVEVGAQSSTAPVPPRPAEASAGPTVHERTSGHGASMGSAGDAELRLIPVGEIHPNPRQPRDIFDEDDMDELVASIGQVGVLQPIVVREVDGPSPYELVMGERRWRAAQVAGLDEIPAIVRHTADTDLLRDALLENLHRSQLNPLEEAAAYEQLLEDFNCTQDELSSRIGRSRPQITNTLRLLKLPPLVQRRVASGVLSAGHARALLSLVDPAEMERLAQKVVSEGLSVRATEELVSLQDGVRQVKPQSRAKRTDRHERLDYLANSLTDRLDTTVKITLGARKGKIAIDFASVDDLNRIMDLIGQSQAHQSQV
ncbi:ParB/RepB/Spo0J family partition protein [Citricoccus sp. NPDC055426]|uniref:ParB/RepB/Spo0J family partition protein n=1 Tax=Citricoccus sp. NPDC055426 TaxID=3155536 RepID=UPI0034479EC0